MRKADVPKIEKTMNISAAHIKRAAGLLDKENGDRLRLEGSILSEEKNIEEYKQSARNYQEALKEAERLLKLREEELAKLPPPTFDEAKAQEIMDKVIALPWVATLSMRDNSLKVMTAPGVLKTTFYDRAVYGNNNTEFELLDEPLSLPLPTYEISIDLTNLFRGSWANSTFLKIRMAIQGEVDDFGYDGEMCIEQRQRAHWATDRQAFDWASICLGFWEETFTNAGKEGIVELLSALAMFLQVSGWAGAYTSKKNWAVELGFLPYRLKLRRPLVEDETRETIRANNRRRLPEFLKKFDISDKMYQEGAEHSDENQGRANTVGRGLADLIQHNERIMIDPARMPISPTMHIGASGGAGTIGPHYTRTPITAVGAAITDQLMREPFPIDDDGEEHGDGDSDDDDE